ncbi:MAG: hypothetical protein KGI04_02990 [Candidatus Micrarchaeota archaeon]|nr:hypothetical protein [Candidatus Micrarchaeota archaeon]
MEGRTTDPMEAVRRHIASDTLARVGRDLIELSLRTSLRNGSLRDSAFAKAKEMLEHNPHLVHKTLAKAAFGLAIQDADLYNSKVQGAIRDSLEDKSTSWIVLMPTMRRQLANAGC